MKKVGDLLIDKSTGDSWEILENSESSGGKRVVFKITQNRKGEFLPNHFHETQDETFKVLSGELTLYHNGKNIVVKAGNEVLLPKMEAHNHYNGSNSTVIFTHTIEPALDAEHLMETFVGLAGEAKDPSFLQKMVFLRYFEGKTYMESIPLGLQKIIINVFGPIGRLFGYRAIYKKYSGFEK